MKTTIAVDILCDWLGYEPAYRVYVDGDMLTERTYIWDNKQQYVREHLEVELDPGVHHLTVEPIINHGTQAQFRTANCTIDGKAVELVNSTFTI